MPRCVIARIMAVTLLACPAVRAGQWLTIAGDFQHAGQAEFGPPNFDDLRWPGGQAELPLLGSSPAVWAGYVVVLGEIFDGAVPINQSVIAYDRASGAMLWETPIDYPPFVNNNPTIDVVRQAVLVAADRNLYSIALADGSVNWTTPITRTTNSTFAVLGDLGYVTDYDGFGTGASLYALNLDADDPVFSAGDIVWQAPIGGASGATPALGDDRIYVGSKEGRIHAFDPLTGTPLWTTVMPATPEPGGTNGWGMAALSFHNGFIYAASYNFETVIGEYNSHLVKLDAATGDLLWHVASERSFSTPVVVADRIYLTGGIAGGFGGGSFGSVPRLMCFQDLGDSAILEWDTSLVGGTTFHLVHTNGKLYAGLGKPFPEDFDYGDLYIFDSTKTPDDPAFVIDHVPGVGASPALADGVLYTIGLAGLFAFGSPEPIPGDLDRNGTVNLFDFAIFAGCFGACDAASLPAACSLENFQRSNIDGLGCVNLLDFATFANNFGSSQ